MSNVNEIVEVYSGLYNDNVVIRALLQLIPGGGVVDAIICDTMKKIKKIRQERFFIELKDGKIKLTEEIIKNEDFLHCFFITYNAAIRTRSEEKIGYLAKLLCGSVEDSMFSDVDDYEEILGVVSDLSCREIKLLVLLDDFETKYPQKDNENELQRVNHYWDEFVDAASDLCKRSELDALMSRLTRSGFYKLITVMFWDYQGNQGTTTPFFKRIKEIAKLKAVSKDTATS